MSKTAKDQRRHDTKAGKSVEPLKHRTGRLEPYHRPPPGKLSVDAEPEDDGTDFAPGAFDYLVRFLDDEEPETEYDREEFLSDWLDGNEYPEPEFDYRDDMYFDDSY